MGLFTKRRDDSGPDPELTFLTVDEAQRVRALVRESFARNGLEVTVHAGHVSDAAGRQFGLWNVAAKCHHHGKRKEWPSVVDEHVATLLAGADRDPLEGLSDDEIVARTYVRLYAATDVRDLDDRPHREFAPGLVELLAFDQPDSVMAHRGDDVRRLGGWAALRERGLANLARDPVQDHQRIGVGDGATIHAVNGDSVYTASKALLLPGLAARLGDEPGEHGWLLVVPNRHQLAWHVVRDVTMFEAAQALVHVARSAYADSAGPLSPHLFWSNGTAYQQLTRYEDDRIVIAGDAEFEAMLERLG